MLEHTQEQRSRKDRVRVIGKEGEACSSFSAVKASMMPPFPFHVHIHSVTEIVLNDRAFLFSLYLL